MEQLTQSDIDELSHVLDDIGQHQDGIAHQLKAESVDSALGGSMAGGSTAGGSTVSPIGDPTACSTPIKLTEREQELAKIIDEIDNEMDDELAEFSSNGTLSLPATLRFDTLSTPTQLLAHTNSDSARVQLLMDHLRRCQGQLREAKYRCDVLEVERDSQKRTIQEEMEARMDGMISDNARKETALRGKITEQQAENKALTAQLQQVKDELSDKCHSTAATMWKHTETMQRLQSELRDAKLMLKKSESQLQEELRQRKDTAGHVVRLNNQIKMLQVQQQNAPQLTRKINVFEEQVSYLTKNLEDSRREHALKVAAMEQKLITETNKLKVKEKDYHRKYKREQERNRSHSLNIKTLAMELRQVKEDIKMGAVIHKDGVKIPMEGAGWSKFKLESKKNQKALQDILLAIESEGGPDSNHQHPSDAAYFQIIIFYLWWRREDAIKYLKETRDKLKSFENCPNNFKEVISERDSLKERVHELEERLGDWMAENDSLQSSANLTTTQLVGTKHELELKVQHLQDTVSALHLDNNLLRVELERAPTPKLTEQVQDMTADLHLKLDVAETELKQEKLVTEELKRELKHGTLHCEQLTKALQTKEDEHKIAAKKCKENSSKIIELEKKKSLLEAQVTKLHQENISAKDNAQKLDKKLKGITSEMGQTKHKQNQTNRARDALKAQIDALKGELIEVRAENVSLMQDNETLEGRLEDSQEELEKAQTRLEVQQQEIVSKSTEEQVETQVLTETLQSEQDRMEELDLEIIRKNAKIAQLQLQSEQQEKKCQKKIQIEKAKFSGLQDALKEKDNEVSELKQKLRDEVTTRNSKLLGMKHEMVVQEGKVQQEHAMEMKRIQEQMEDLDKELAEKEEEHKIAGKKLAEVIAEKEDTITDLEMQVADILAEKEGEISDLQKKIEDQDEASMSDKEEQMSHLKGLEEHEKALMDDLKGEKEKCESLQKSIQGKNEEINELIKNMEERVNERNTEKSKLEELKEELAKQEGISSTKLQDMQDKYDRLQENVEKKDEFIAELERKLWQESNDKKASILKLEKQLQDQEKNFHLEVEEEGVRMGQLEDMLKEKEATIAELQLRMQEAGHTSALSGQKKIDEAKRMDEMIKLEEKISELIDEKDRMQDKMQIMSKDKTILQADKQLLELELEDRTKKLQRIMKQYSITGSNNCSRSSSRRSSIESRPGRIRRDSEKDVKKSKKNKDELDKSGNGRGGKDNKGKHSGKDVKKVKRNKASTFPDGIENGVDMEDLTKPENGSQSFPYASEEENKGKLPCEISKKDSNKSSKNNISNVADESDEVDQDVLEKSVNSNELADKISDEGEKERLERINDFVTNLLDLHLSMNTEEAIESVRNDIETLQQNAANDSATSDSNQPIIEQHNAVVAKLGALFQIMKAKQRMADDETRQDGEFANAPVSDVLPMDISEAGGVVQHNQARISQPDVSCSRKEHSLAHCTPETIAYKTVEPLLAGNSNNDESQHLQASHITQSTSEMKHDQNPCDGNTNIDNSKIETSKDTNATNARGQEENRNQGGGVPFEHLSKFSKEREVSAEKCITTQHASQREFPDSNKDVSDTPEVSDGICKEQSNSKEKFPETNIQLNTTCSSPEEKLLYGTGDLSSYGAVSDSRADGSLADDGDDDVFCDEGGQNLSELERIAIMHELVAQLRQSPNEEMNIFRSRSSSQAESLQESHPDDSQIDPFEVETWLIETGGSMSEKQLKPLSLQMDEEITFPMPSTIDYNTHPLTGENYNGDNESLIMDNLALIMDGMGCKDESDIDEDSLDSDIPGKLNNAESDPNTWLAEVAKALENRVHPQSLVPDEEVIAPEMCEQECSLLLRTFQLEDLESEWEPKKGSWLHSSNPSSNMLSKSLSLDTDGSYMAGGSTKRLGSMRRSRSADAVAKVNEQFGSGKDKQMKPSNIPRKNGKLGRRLSTNSDTYGSRRGSRSVDNIPTSEISKQTKTQREVPGMIHSNKKDDTSKDTDKLSDFVSGKSSSGSFEDVHWGCENQARHMGLREYTPASKSPSGKSKAHKGKPQRKHTKRQKHCSSDSSENEPLKRSDTVSKGPTGDPSKTKNKLGKKRRQLPSLIGSKIPISTGMQEAQQAVETPGSSIDLSEQESYPQSRTRVCKSKEEIDEPKLRETSRNYSAMSDEMQPVHEEALALRTAAPSHTTEGKQMSSEVPDEINFSCSIIPNPDLQTGLLAKCKKDFHSQLIDTACQTDNIVHMPDEYKETKTTTKQVSSSTIECQTDDLEMPYNKLPSATTAECQTDLQMPSVASACQTDSRIPSTTTMCQTDSEIIFVATACQTDSQIPSTAVTCQADSQVPFIIPGCQTDSQIPSTAPGQQIDSQIPSTAPGCQTDSRIPSTAPGCQTDSQVPSTVPGCQTHSQVPSKVPGCQTESQISSTAQGHQTDSQIPSTAPGCQTYSQVPSTVPGCQTNSQVPSTVPGCQTNSQIPSTAPGRLTDCQIPSTAPGHQTDSRVPSTIPGCQTDSQIPSTAQGHQTDSQIPSTAPGCQIESQIPFTALGRQIDSQIPYTAPACHTDSQVPSKVPGCQTNSQIPYTAQGHQTDSQIPSTAQGCQIESQIPFTALGRQIDSQIPYTAPARHTDSQVPSRVPGCQTDSQIPYTAPACQTDSQIQSTSPGCQTESQIPFTATGHQIDSQIPYTVPLCQTESQIPSTAPGCQTESQIPSTTPGCQIDSQIPSTAPGQRTDSQIPPTNTACQTDPQIPSKAAGCQTDSQIHAVSIEAECQTDSQIPSAAAECETDSQIQPTAAECQTDSQIPSTAAECQTDSQISSTAAECQTDSQIPSTAAECQTDSQISSTAAECQTDSQIPSTAAECQTDSQIPSTAAECQTDSQISSTAAESQTDSQISSTAAECQTDSQIPFTATACQTDSQILSTATGCQTNSQIPSIAAECQTDSQIPSIATGSQTNSQIPSIATSCQTDSQIPSSAAAACQTDFQIPFTTAAFQTEKVVSSDDLTPSTVSEGSQTDDDIHITLQKDTVEDLINLSDRQKMKAKAFKETARAYKGELQRMHQQMQNDKEDLALLEDKSKTQEANLHQLTHKNNELEADLNLTRDYLDKKKDECKDLQQSMYDAEIKERDLTSTLKEIQDQLGIEMQIQDKLNQRCEELESDILETKSKLLNPDSSGTDGDDLNESSSSSSSRLSPNKTAKQVQNETDDRKKISEYIAKAKMLEAKTDIDKIVIDSLTEENQHLRSIIDKLKDKAYSKWKENPDSRLEDIYHALAKAQVKAMAMKIAENPDDILDNTTFGDTFAMPPSPPRPASSGLGTTMGSDTGYL